MAFIALGGFFGAIIRYSCSLWLPRYWGTFFVNVVGSFFIGVTMALSLHDALYSAVVIGFLGAFTTFSTFSLETITLLQAKQYKAAFYQAIVATVICFAATAIGFFIADL